MDAPNRIKKMFSYFRLILSFEIYCQVSKSQIICCIFDFGLYPFVVIKGRSMNHEYFDPCVFVLSCVVLILTPEYPKTSGFILFREFFGLENSKLFIT